MLLGSRTSCPRDALTGPIPSRSRKHLTKNELSLTSELLHAFWKFGSRPWDPNHSTLHCVGLPTSSLTIYIDASIVPACNIMQSNTSGNLLQKKCPVERTHWGRLRPHSFRKVETHLLVRQTSHHKKQQMWKTGILCTSLYRPTQKLSGLVPGSPSTPSKAKFLGGSAKCTLSSRFSNRSIPHPPLCSARMVMSWPPTVPKTVSTAMLSRTWAKSSLDRRMYLELQYVL